ncbi:MAG: DUF2917 domain-containing protein [Syntrophaceae bacterium]
MQSENIFHLRDGELFSIKGNCAGTVICCRAGVLWLTQQGDPADHLIRAGEDFAVSRRGLVLISALAESEVGIGTDQPGVISPACSS